MVDTVNEEPTLTEIDEKLDTILERLDEIEEKIANIRTPGSGFGIEEYGD